MQATTLGCMQVRENEYSEILPEQFEERPILRTLEKKIDYPTENGIALDIQNARLTSIFFPYLFSRDPLW